MGILLGGGLPGRERTIVYLAFGMDIGENRVPVLTSRALIACLAKGYSPMGSQHPHRYHGPWRGGHHPLVTSGVGGKKPESTMRNTTLGSAATRFELNAWKHLEDPAILLLFFMPGNVPIRKMQESKAGRVNYQCD